MNRQSRSNVRSSRGLTREGFSVAGGGSAAGAAPVEIIDQGTVRVWSIEVHDPQFRYVRWCTDAVIEEEWRHIV